MDQPILQKIYTELLYRKIVSNQQDLGEKIGKSKGYISKLLQTKDSLPLSVQLKLNELFGITREYLSSNGKTGTMFAGDDSTKEKAYDNTKIEETPTVNEEDTSITYKNYTPMERDLMRELRYNSESMRMMAQALLNATETNKSQAHAIEMLSGKRSGEEQYPKSRAS